MKIGVLTPSIYMYKTRHKERIFAPAELARHLVTGLVDRGHKVTWFSAPDEDTKATLVPGDRELLERDLKMRAFQDLTPEALKAMSLYGSKMYYEMDLVTRAFDAAKKGEIDLVHVFHSFGYLAYYFGDLTGIPTLFTLHDPIPSEDMLEHWLLKRFTTPRLISISLAQQGAFGEHFVGNVYNGIDENEFAFDGAGGERFIAVGRMVAPKGFDHAIEAVRAVGGKLTIASWMTDTIKKAEFYKEKIEPHVDGQSVIVDSLLTGPARIELYQKAKALLFPIRWPEPFGLVMAEAMSCGTPVIGYNMGSVSEVVLDGVTGFIIDYDNEDRPKKGTWIIKKQGIEGLVEAMKRIGEIDRSNCRKHVQEYFTIDTMVQGYEGIYEKAVGAK